jgi:hypothetical protein
MTAARKFEEVHGQAAHAAVAAIPLLPSENEGAGSSFQKPRPPRGLNRRWCIPCNGMRDHLYATCLMDLWHR